MAYKVPSYSSFSNDYDSYAKKYNSYTSGLSYSNPFSTIVSSTPSSVSDEIAQSWSANTYATQSYNLPAHRSILDRGLDLLMTPNYAIAGAFKGAIDPNMTIGEGFIGGFRAGIDVFGQGYEQGETTFSDVLDTAGWRPEGGFGKFMRGAVGFGLDVALDPTTYMTFGVGAALKGTGRAALAATHARPLARELGALYKFKPSADLLEVPNQVKRAIVKEQVEKGINPNLAERFAERKVSSIREQMNLYTSGMTDDMAKSIIERQAKERGLTLTAAEVATDSKKLSERFNKLVGLRGEAEGITFGTSNLPFARGGSKTTLKSGSVLQEGAEASGVAEIYGRLRSQIYGSKIGELFSTNAPLYRLTKEDPGKLYDFIKFVDHTQGLKVDKLSAEKLIRDKAKMMNIDMTPSEMKDVLALLQDKRIWTKASSMVKFVDTQEAKEYRRAVEKKKKNLQRELDDILETRKTVDALRVGVSSDIIKAEAELKYLESDYRDKLSRLTKSNSLTESQHKQLISALEDEARQLSSDIELAASREADFDSQLIKQLSSKEYTDNVDLARDLSRAIYGDEKSISATTDRKLLDSLSGKLKNGSSRREVLDYIQSNSDKFNGRAKTIYSFAAEELGYGSGTKYPSWKEFYHDRMAELEKKFLGKGISKEEALSPHELRLYNELVQAQYERSLILSRLGSMKSMDEIMDYITSVKNDKMWREFNEIEHMTNTTGRSAPRNANRDKIADDISARLDYGRGDDMRYAELQDKSSYNVKMVGDERTNFVIDLMSRTGEFNKNSRANMAWYELVADEANNLLEKLFKREVSELTEKQYDLLVSLSFKNASSRKAGTSVIEALGEEAKAAQKILDQRAELARIDAIQKQVLPKTDVRVLHSGKMLRGVVEQVSREDGVIKYSIRTKNGDLVEGVTPSQIKTVISNKTQYTPDELVAQSPITKELVEKRDAIVKQIEAMKSSGPKVESLDGFMEGYIERANDLKKTIADLEVNEKNYKDALEYGDLAKASEIERQISRAEEVLASDEAFETYMQSVKGPKWMEKVVGKEANESTTVAEIMLNPDLNLDDRIKNLVMALRKDFMDIGKEEVQIGKLKQEQVDALLMDYVPHILTTEGQRFFNKYDLVFDPLADAHVVVEKEIKKKKPNLTNDLGFGTVFNQHALSRTIKNVMIDDEWVSNPTIEQINRLLSPYLKGKNAFSENIADIYLTRALRHTELMYDNEYMNTMLNKFGKVIGDEGVEEGYKAVANFGRVKEFVNTQAIAMAKNKGASGSDLVESAKEMAEIILDDLGLSPKMLDELATPMIELSEMQIDKFRSVAPDLLRQVNSVIVDKANQSRKLQIAKDQNKFLQFYDKATHFFKLNQTTVMPAFHARNKLANIYLNWLGVGREAFNLKSQHLSFKTVRAKGEKIGDMFTINKLDGTVESMSWGDAYELAKVHGVIDEGFFAAELGAEAATTGLLKGIVPSKYDPTDTSNFIPYKKGSEIGSLVENSDRLIHFIAQLKNGMSPEQAAESVHKFLFDYSDVTRFEATYMKRIFPFYTWLRKNGKLQLQQMLEQPEKFQTIAKIRSGIEGMVDEEDRIDDRFVNDFATDWIQTPWSVRNPQGRTEPVLWNPNLPFQDLSRLPNPLQPKDSLIGLFTQSNPLIKIPVEQLMNRNMFFDQPIVDEGESQVLNRSDHILSQLSMYTAAKGAVTKDGLDLGLHLLNTTSGVKLLSYDYEAYKRMRLKELMGEFDSHR